MRLSRPFRPRHLPRLGTGISTLLILSGIACSRAQGPDIAVGPSTAVAPDTAPAAPVPTLPILEPPLPSPDAALTTAPAPALAPAPVDTITPGSPLPSDGGGVTGGTANAAGDGNAPAPDADLTAAAPPSATTARRFRYAFRLSLGVVYDDNVSLRGGSSGGDAYFTIEPGVTAGFGDIVGRSSNYVRLDYAPTAQLYASRSDATALQHLIRLEGQYVFGHLTLSGSQDVQILDGADLNVTTNTGTTINRVNLDVSARTRVNIYVTRVIANYGLSEKSALSLALLYNDNDYRSLISSQTVSADFSFNYIYSPKLTLGLAASAGYLAVQEPNPSQTFEQVNLRASYQTTGKIAVNASFGLEVRQFENASDQNVTPVLEIGALYQPFDGTTVSLSANRRVLSSATVSGQDYTSTGFTVSVRQRFFTRFFPTLTFGYENSQYFGTGTVGNPNANGATTTRNFSRSDNYLYVQPAVEARIRDNWTATLFYTHRSNTSTGTSNASFSDNQFGVRTSVNF